MNNAIRLALKIVLPLLVLAGAVFVAATLVRSRPEAPKKQRPDRAQLVSVQTVQRATQRIDVRAQGSVQAARRVRMQPQVTGTITRQHEQLVPGGFIKEGESLMRIDASDYRLVVEQQELNLDTARANLDVEQGRQVIAAKEWELFNEGAKGSESDPSLALRQPQLKQSQITIKLAQAQLKQARVNLSRTNLKAPFNAVVLTEDVETGQLVSSQTLVATLVGTDAFWVRASVPLDQLGRVAIPGINAGAGEGSMAKIEQDLGAGTITYEARVVRLLSELEQVGRMAQLLLEVKDPFGLEQKEAGNKKPPLLLGSYVTVVFEGSQQRELIEIPRVAVHDGSTVWVLSAENTLDIRQVNIVSSSLEHVLVDEGIRDGERVITSQIGTPIQGAKLKPETAQAQTAQRASSREEEEGEQ